MGGKGSGGARIGAGRKPKPPKKPHPNWGGRRESAGRKMFGEDRRIPLNIYVAPSTKETIQSVKESEGVSEGIAVDRLATFYTEHKDIDDGGAEISASSPLNDNH